MGRRPFPSLQMKLMLLFISALLPALDAFPSARSKRGLTAGNLLYPIRCTCSSIWPLITRRTATPFSGVRNGAASALKDLRAVADDFGINYYDTESESMDDALDVEDGGYDDFTALLRRQLMIAVSACGAVHGELFLQTALRNENDDGDFRVATDADTDFNAPAYLQLVCQYGDVTAAESAAVDASDEEYGGSVEGATAHGLVLCGAELTAAVQFQQQMYGLLRLRRAAHTDWHREASEQQLNVAALVTQTLGEIIGLEVQRMADAAEDEAYIQELQDVLHSSQVYIPLTLIRATCTNFMMTVTIFSAPFVGCFVAADAPIAVVGLRCTACRLQ